MIVPDDAWRQAKFEAGRLAATDRWRAAFTGAESRPPQLVNAATAPYKSGRNYYIVDFRIGERSTGRMIVDAQSGEVGQVAGLRKGQAALPVFLAPTELPRLIVVKYSDDKEVRLTSGQFRVDTALLWTPCAQSPSPFQPFYVVRQDPDVAYVRVDGEVYAKITRGFGG